MEDKNEKLQLKKKNLHWLEKSNIGEKLTENELFGQFIARNLDKMSEKTQRSAKAIIVNMVNNILDNQ